MPALGVILMAMATGERIEVEPLRPAPRDWSAAIVWASAFVWLVILLGAIASTRYTCRTPVTEPASILAEMVSKELTYRVEYGHFADLRFDGEDDLPAEHPNTYFPAVEKLAPDRRHEVSSPHELPISWRRLGASPRPKLWRCGYAAFAGEGERPKSFLARRAFTSGRQGGPWFYAVALCPVKAHRLDAYVVSSDSPQLVVIEDAAAN